MEHNDHDDLVVLWDHGGHDDHDYLDLDPDTEFGLLDDDDDNSSANDHSDHEHVLQPPSSSDSSSNSDSSTSESTAVEEDNMEVENPSFTTVRSDMPDVSPFTAHTAGHNGNSNGYHLGKNAVPPLPNSSCSATAFYHQQQELDFANYLLSEIMSDSQNEHHFVSCPAPESLGAQTTQSSMNKATEPMASDGVKNKLYPKESAEAIDRIMAAVQYQAENIEMEEPMQVRPQHQQQQNKTALPPSALKKPLRRGPQLPPLPSSFEPTPDSVPELTPQPEEQPENASSNAAEPRASDSSASDSTENHPAVVAHDPKSWNERMLVFSVVYVMSFAYKAGSQLPYVYFLLELVNTYHVNLNLAGLFSALTFICRLITLAVSIRFPRKFSIWGTVLALIGYLMMIFTSAIAKSLSNSESKIPAMIFVAGNIIVGFGEINGSLQIFVKELYAETTTDGMNTVSKYLKTQLTVMRVATVIIYATGGVLYDFLEVTGVATLGAVALLLQLLSLLAMTYLEKATGRDQHVRTKATDAASAAREAIAAAHAEREHSNRGRAVAIEQEGTINGAAIAAAAAAAHGYRGPHSVSSTSDDNAFFIDRDFTDDDSTINNSFRSLVQNELATIEEVSINKSDEDDTTEGVASSLSLNDTGNITGDLTEGRSSSITQQSSAGGVTQQSNTGGVTTGSDDLLLGNLRSSRLSQGAASLALSTSDRSLQVSFVGDRPSRTRYSSAGSTSARPSELPRFRSFSRRDKMAQINRSPSAILGSYTTHNIPIRWIDWFVAFAVSFQSILNGFVFGTGTLLLYEEYGQSKSLIGVIYSVSAVFGVMASILPNIEMFATFMRNKLPSPHSFYFYLFACTYTTMLTAVPNFASFLTGFLTMNVSLGLFVSYLTELQGKISTTENYQKLAPWGQIFRRVSGLAIMFVTPPLYKIMPRLPNIVGSVVCFLFTLVIYIGFEVAKGKSQEELTARLGPENVHRSGSVMYVTTDRERSHRRRRISFAEQIIMSSVLSGRQHVADEQSSLLNDDSTTELQVNYARRESCIEQNMI